MTQTTGLSLNKKNNNNSTLLKKVSKKVKSQSLSAAVAPKSGIASQTRKKDITKSPSASSLKTKATTPVSPQGAKKHITLALQGGGSHGAFTWGVLDRLLEDGRFEIEGLSGTSAGAMNAVATVHGLIKNGNEGAREELHSFWKKVSDLGKNSPLKPSFFEKIQGKYTMNHSIPFQMLGFITKMFSPSQMNPMKSDPLKDVIRKLFDFDKIRKFKKTQLFICATHITTGKIKIFESKDMTVEAMLASACLPTAHHAVEVNGEYYWDGGFIANPALFPLIEHCDTADLIVVQLDPIHRPEVPTTTAQITGRFHEVTGNSTLIREMRAISFISNLIDKGIADSKKIKRMRLHVIANEKIFQELDASSKINTEWEFFTHLFDAGRKTADEWIKKNYSSVGVKSTVDFADYL